MSRMSELAIDYDLLMDEIQFKFYKNNWILLGGTCKKYLNGYILKKDRVEKKVYIF